MRGGGPRYVYNDSALKKMKSNASPFMVINQPMQLPYRDDFLDLKKLTKNQLRILTGIEMYYGNFEELKFIFAAKEIPELMQFLNKVQELTRAKNNMNSIVAQKGMGALQEELSKARALGSEVKKLKTILITDKLPALKAYKIDESDIDKLESS